MAIKKSYQELAMRSTQNHPQDYLGNVDLVMTGNGQSLLRVFSVAAVYWLIGFIFGYRFPFSALVAVRIRIYWSAGNGCIPHANQLVLAIH